MASKFTPVDCLPLLYPNPFLLSLESPPSSRILVELFDSSTVHCGIASFRPQNYTVDPYPSCQIHTQHPSNTPRYSRMLIQKGLPNITTHKIFQNQHPITLTAPSPLIRGRLFSKNPKNGRILDLGFRTQTLLYGEVFSIPFERYALSKLTLCGDHIKMSTKSRDPAV